MIKNKIPFDVPAEIISCQEISDQKAFKNTPMVSVKMITYNHEPYIAQAIEGVLKQERDFPIELIIGEDCSKDQTREIVCEYQRDHPSIIRILTSDNNVGADKNSWRVSAACRGEYIALCEGDDYWTDPFKLQKQVNLLQAHPECSMAVAKTDVYQLENGSFRYQNTIEGVNRDLVYFDDLLKGCYFHTSTYLIPKSNLITYEQYRNKMSLGDTAMRFILIDIGPFAFLRETVSVYRITGNGIWTSLDNYQQTTAHIKLFEDLLAHFKPKYKRYWVKTLAPYYITIILADLKKRQLENCLEKVTRLIYLGLRYAPLQVLIQILRRLLILIRKRIIK
jgi:glycosyltransferase involved in cell wall biosynthesis